MQLKAYLSAMTHEARDAFAAKCETTSGHMRNVMYGFKPCATNLAVRIERESDGSVTRQELRPKDWADHWPELVAVAKVVKTERTKAKAA